MKEGLTKESNSFLKEKVGPAMQDYEIRKSQTDMLNACCGIIEEGGILMAEAGTGTGKTFAYLIPSILSEKRVIISTKTINLQEQLFSKDLKFLSSLHSFDYAKAKGRSNYLCLRRLNAFRSENDEESAEYMSIQNWASDTESGDSEDYGSKKSSIWGKVSSDSDACKGNKCGYFKECFYFKARQKWNDAQVLVANHSLICLNAILHNEAKILPSTDILVIDEGHTLDHVLSEHIGINLSKRGFENILNMLLKLDDRGLYKGVLSNSPHLFGAVESIRTEMDNFWNNIKNSFNNRELLNELGDMNELMNGISGNLKSLNDRIRKEITGLFKEDDELEATAALSKLRNFANELKQFSEGFNGFVRWAEIDEKKIALRMLPIYPRDFVVENIIPEYKTIILTSATLSVNRNFGLISNMLGFEDAKSLTVPSPFDLRKQVNIEIKRGINLQEYNSIETLSQVIIDDASKKDGGVLVLFTSRDVMIRAWQLTSERLAAIGLNPMLQGELSSRVMVETMRASDNSVIFGLDSFWEGVDVKGDSLKSLIITKLPFDVPTDPIVSARTEEITRRGGNSFNEYSLPRAILKFKQGFGRLIRSKNDSGRVIICDERIKTKYYGDRFINSLY